MSAIGKKNFKYTGTDYNEYEVTVWENENPETAAEKYEVTISCFEEMEEITFNSVSDIKKTINRLQKAIEFIKANK